MKRSPSHDDYCQTRPSDTPSPHLFAIIDISGEDVKAVDEASRSIQALAKSFGIGVRGPVPLAGKKLKCGVKTHHRQIEVEADSDFMGSVVKGLELPEGVRLSVSFKERHNVQGSPRQ